MYFEIYQDAADGGERPTLCASMPEGSAARTPDWIAGRAYALAYAMLAAREQQR